MVHSGHSGHSGKAALLAAAGAMKNPEAGGDIQTFTILATTPDELCEAIHDQMPVILSRAEYPMCDLETPNPRHSFSACVGGIGGLENLSSDGLAVIVEEVALIGGHGGHRELRSFNAFPHAGVPGDQACLCWSLLMTTRPAESH
jgi:hypothetical protein